MSEKIDDKTTGATHQEVLWGADAGKDGVHKIDESETTAKNADFAAVVANRPNPWGRGHLQLYCMCFIVYLTSTMNGYDGSLMGSINSVTNYQLYYNLPLNGASSTGIVFAIFQIGQMAGAFFVWVADWQGRRLPIFIGCFGVIVGTIITATAKTLPVFVGGRFLLSFFCTLATTSAPILMLELAPPTYRATVSGLYNTLWYMGSIIATFTVYGANIHLSDTNLNWRLPLWLQMLCPGLVCCFIYFVPESPRWQVAADQHEKARAFIVKHHANGDASHPIVELEMSEIVQSLSTSTLLSWRSFFDIRDLLRTRARRYRTGINFCFSWFGQFSGNNVISYYLPLLVAQVGITNPNTQLLLNAIYAITGWIAAIIGARLHDVLGRRTMFLASTAGMVLCLAIAAGGAAGYTEGSIPASKASISFIYVFGVVFAVAYTSMQPIYPAEVMTNDMRAKGMFLFQWTAGAAGFLNTFVAPIALKNIGYWFYVFFCLWDVVEFAVIYFFFVETKGRTLEELDEVFNSKNPRKASTAVVRVRTTRLVDEKGNETVAVDAI